MDESRRETCVPTLGSSFQISKQKTKYLTESLIMCFGSSPAPPPPPPPAPPPPFKRAGSVESPTTKRRGITRRKKGTSQLTTSRPTTGGIQSGQYGVSMNQG